MQLQLQTFGTLVATAGTAVQAAAKATLDLTVGSTLRAILEANASIALWIQWLILRVLQVTRASTSEGADLDSWMADFTVSRLPAVPAQGIAAFGRFNAQGTAYVPLDTTVRTADGVQSFKVTADLANTAYQPPASSASQGAYILGVGINSVAVPVRAVNAGTVGNIKAGTINLIGAALPGIDTVVNMMDCTGGLDAESDAALRGRFANFLASRARATPAAIAYAVASVQQGLQWTIQENVLPDLTPRMGNVLVTVDDGSGAPPPSLLTSVSAAIEAVRPVATSFAVQPPIPLTANVQMTITTTPDALHSTAAQLAASSITSWINALPIGVALPYSRLAQLAYGAHSAITNVTAVTLNAGTTDLVPAPSGVVRANTITVV